MAVEDHPIHEKVKHDKYPCSLRDHPERKQGYTVLTRDYLPNGTYRLVPEYVEDRMSTGCRGAFGEFKQGKWQDLLECEGCLIPRDTEYIERQRKLEDAQRSTHPDNGLGRT